MSNFLLLGGRGKDLRSRRIKKFDNLGNLRWKFNFLKPKKINKKKFNFLKPKKKNENLTLLEPLPDKENEGGNEKGKKVVWIFHKLLQWVDVDPVVHVLWHLCITLVGFFFLSW